MEHFNPAYLIIGLNIVTIVFSALIKFNDLKHLDQDVKKLERKMDEDTVKIERKLDEVCERQGQQGERISRVEGRMNGQESH